MPGTQSKANEAALALKLIAGTQKHLSSVTQLILESGTYTPAQVEAQLQAFADLRAAVDAAKAALKAKLVLERTVGAPLRVFLVTFIAYVRAAFGNSPDILADFGLPPKKVRKSLTADEKAAAAAKRKSTRKARGTLGKRQKLEVKGDVTGIVITPVTASPAPPATPSPSGATPTGAPTK